MNITLEQSVLQNEDFNQNLISCNYVIYRVCPTLNVPILNILNIAFYENNAVFDKENRVM